MSFIKSGTTNTSLHSSSGQFSYIPLLTLDKVSIPTRSAVLKVADLGLPISGPVKVSRSSIEISNSFILWKRSCMPKLPILFPINPGVSLAKTDVLPKNFSPNILRNSTTSSLQFGPGTISNNFKYLGGLKK